MTAPTYSQSSLAAFLTGYLGRPVSRQSVKGRLDRGTIPPGALGTPCRPLWSQDQVERIAEAWDTVDRSGPRKRARVPGSRRDRKERREAAGHEGMVNKS